MGAHQRVFEVPLCIPSPFRAIISVPKAVLTCALSKLQLCAGAIRSKNTLNILLQTILDACVSGIMWYVVG